MSKDENRLVYNVVAQKETLLEDGTLSYDMVLLGAFLDMEDAVIHMFTIKDLDTSVEEVTVVTSRLFEEIPDADLFLSIEVSRGLVKVRTVCADSSFEPMLRDDQEAFEMLGYLEDQEQGIRLAKQWHEAKYGEEPEVDIYLSPKMSDYFY